MVRVFIKQIELKLIMPKSKIKLPAWSNEPLKFTFPPDGALRHCAFNKLPEDWKKAV
jgi:hypothetical protein